MTLLPIFALALSALAFSALAIPPSAPNLHGRTSLSAVLCFDSRYATTHPNLRDCSEILNAKMFTTPRPLNFSRNPRRDEYPLPHTWTADRKGCVVKIDIPELPSLRLPRVESSMLDVKHAVFEVMKRCVIGKPHLGGFVGTGTLWGLQVEVLGEDDEGTRAGRSIGRAKWWWWVRRRTSWEHR
ncbi:MAG: hypothetical protein L6R39_000382 [Caloplaca ligustica]|nr:MAG: hypothetical protein L6R39_000382 [Caloplaca ligustica]